MAQETAGRGTSRPLETASAAVEGAADGLADGIEREGLGHSLPRAAGEVAPIAQRGVRSERLRSRLDKADEKVSRAVEATKVRARAVAESARRARRAPPHVLADVKDAARAYGSGVAASVGFYGAAGLVAAIAAIVLTVALIQGLNELWGKPWGTFAVGALYAVVAFGLLAAARGRAEAGRKEAKAKLEEARAELRSVAEPVREAFRSHPSPPSAAPLETSGAMGYQPAPLRPLAGATGTVGSMDGGQAPHAAHPGTSGSTSTSPSYQQATGRDEP